MRSMTGFGEGAGENEHTRVSVTLRGVNHRYLDVVVKLRDELRGSEGRLRERIAARIWRGRVEVVVEIESLAAGAVEVSFDPHLVRALHAVSQELVDGGLIAHRLEFGDLLRIPDAVRIRSGNRNWSDDDDGVLLAALDQALDQFVVARETEGHALRAIFEERLDALGALTERPAERRAELPQQMATALNQRIRELADVPELDPDRLAQEVAILVDRSDVREELDRLGSHLDHFRAILDQDGSIGKRLDFLAQEIFRELNTVGSKCRDSDLTRGVLDGKTLCEQLREQVQNVE